MTRENKLALVVGFALIMLVGILISDHFSEAQHEEPAEFARAVDPLNVPRDHPDLIAQRGALMPATEIVDPTHRERDLTVVPIPRHVEMGGSQIRPAAVTLAPPPAPAPRQFTPPQVTSTQTTPVAPRPRRGQPAVPRERSHTIQPREALSTICLEYYGRAGLVDELAKANGIDDPDTILVGQVLRIPPELKGRSVTAAAPAAITTPTAEATPDAGERTYTVRDNDNLSKIAKKLLGSLNDWNAIYEANRDVLDSPDDLRPGMTLRIPRRQG